MPATDKGHQVETTVSIVNQIHPTIYSTADVEVEEGGQSGLSFLCPRSTRKGGRQKLLARTASDKGGASSGKIKHSRGPTSKIREIFLMAVGIWVFLIAQVDIEQQSVMKMIHPELTQEIDLTRQSSFVYAGRRYLYRYSVKLFAETEKVFIARNATKMKIGEDSLPSIVFGVCSFGPDKARRDMIRKTWGSKESHVFFIVANPPNIGSDSNISIIMDELVEHADLIWLDIPENYRHALTPKSFAFMHFMNHHFLARIDDGSRAVLDPSRKSSKVIDYIFKADDDVFINTTEIRTELKAKGQPEYYGMSAIKSVLRPTGDLNHTPKHALTIDEYPRGWYPLYCHGTGYAISTQSAFFHYGQPTITETTGKSFKVLSNFLVADYTPPPLVSFDEFQQIVSGSNEAMTGSCTEQVMASMLPMPWEDVGTGLLSEACNVSISFANDEWTPYSPEIYMHGGVLVKVLHNVKLHWFEPLMIQGSLMEADIQHEKTTHKSRNQEKNHVKLEKSM